jgi:hypothetical protein
MEIKDLVGIHKLSGVDMSNEKIKEEWGDGFDDCQVINFILDKKTYTVIEDPSDGYRSSMKEIKLSKVVVKNVFAPIQVYGVLWGEINYNNHDGIDFYDTKTNKIVLSVGTRDVDDYYPLFVAIFIPENMSLNFARKNK